MKTSEFDYELPKDLIAQRPASPRDSSRLLIFRETISHRKFSDLTDYLERDDVLVINTTKVIHAKICGHKDTGGAVECLLVSRKTPTIYAAILFGKRLRPGTSVLFRGGSFTVRGELDRMFEIEFSKKPVLKDIGEMPLPPYINVKCHEKDYQTVYANKPGSIAAPTAGLHFSKRVFAALTKKGVKTARIVLHVGAGTFLPVKTDDIEGHKMHTEDYEISERDARLINNRKGKLIVVGTTTMRCLESACDDKGKLSACKGSTGIFIYPGYKFKSKADALITNFHLPKSTLLMLVSAYAVKERIMAAYKEAVRKRYRFYSFGDAMMIFPKKGI